jgi:hypothetical protein
MRLSVVLAMSCKIATNTSIYRIDRDAVWLRQLGMVWVWCLNIIVSLAAMRQQRC